MRGLETGEPFWFTAHLGGARDLLAAVKAPLEDVKAAQAVEALERADFMGKGGGKALEERHKRELTSKEREGIGEVLNVAESWLRDCLMVSQGVADLAVNSDAVESVAEVASVITPAAAAKAQQGSMLGGRNPNIKYT